ncbi:MAG: dinitrogenase iron-molybdenum cofactor biosynthesis protein [Spirochaetes bacterium]|nr:MAG: dinitrogenase iron-molybdenum cofactor biosynthesis protein [Spirochaetota bacterium]
MIIAFSSEEDKGLESIMSHHFGRCPFYVFVSIDEDNTVTNVTDEPNPFANGHEPGLVPKYIADKGVNIMISGGMGPRAIDFFNQFGVTVVTAASGKVKDALNAYLSGQLKGYEPCNEGGNGSDDCGQKSKQKGGIGMGHIEN